MKRKLESIVVGSAANILSTSKSAEILPAHSINDIKFSPCRQPAFSSQIVVKTDGLTELDEENSIGVIYDAFELTVLKPYIESSLKVDRISGKSAFNSMKPRREICYTITGNSYKYSGVKHNSAQYPDHVLDIIPKIRDHISLLFPTNTFNTISNGVDIIYDSQFVGGGSIGAHGDNEGKWGLVVIFSLGQTRWLRIRRLSDKKWFNVEMRHNSLIMMHGKSFQMLYTHQVDKLKDSELVLPRLSLNVRFEEGEDNLNQVLSASSGGHALK